MKGWQVVYYKTRNYIRGSMNIIDIINEYRANRQVKKMLENTRMFIENLKEARTEELRKDLSLDEKQKTAKKYRKIIMKIYL